MLLRGLLNASYANQRPAPKQGVVGLFRSVPEPSMMNHHSRGRVETAEWLPDGFPVFVERLVARNWWFHQQSAQICNTLASNIRTLLETTRGAAAIRLQGLFVAQGNKAPLLRGVPNQSPARRDNAPCEPREASCLQGDVQQRRIVQGLRALGIQRMKTTLQQLRRLHYARLRVRSNRWRRAHRLQLRPRPRPLRLPPGSSHRQPGLRCLVQHGELGGCLGLVLLEVLQEGRVPTRTVCLLVDELVDPRQHAPKPPFIPRPSLASRLAPSLPPLARVLCQAYGLYNRRGAVRRGC